MHLVSDFVPTNNQQKAINSIINNLGKGQNQTLKGITGSGKTFVLANVISKSKNASIVLAPNKILAYQLYQELLKFFPNDFVGYYVSNYDVYIPAFYSAVTNRKEDAIVVVNQKNKELRYSVKDYLALSEKAIIVCSTTSLFPTFKDDIISTVIENREYLFDRLKNEKSKQVNSFIKEGKIEEATLLEAQIDHTINMMIREPEYFNSNMIALLNEKLGDFYLFDYFKDSKPDLYIDESHLSLIQINAMSLSNNNRLKLLINKGYYINNVLKDNILNFNQVKNKVNNIIFVSATPSKFELETSNNIVELITRPNNIPDPKIIQKPRSYFGSKQMINDIKTEEGTIFINCFSRKSVNILGQKLKNLGIEFETIHYKIKNDKRKKILNDLREGKIKVILGINMLREGIDIHQCSLVIIEEADGGTFLRTKSCLIQMSGRAARNKNGKIFMCYDKPNECIVDCINEINYRRKIQLNEDYIPLIFEKKLNILIRKGDIIKLKNDDISYQIINYYSDNRITINSGNQLQEISKEQIECVL